MSDRDHPSAVLGDTDFHLFNEGTHARLYEKLGAQIDVDERGTDGVRFSVWAPNAERVRVVGDWNGWGDSSTELSPLESSRTCWVASSIEPTVMYPTHCVGASGIGALAMPPSPSIIVWVVSPIGTSVNVHPKSAP